MLPSILVFFQTQLIALVGLPNALVALSALLYLQVAILALRRVRQAQAGNASASKSAEDKQRKVYTWVQTPIQDFGPRREGLVRSQNQKSNLLHWQHFLFISWF